MEIHFISSRSPIQEAKHEKNKNKRQQIQDQREGIHKAWRTPDELANNPQGSKQSTECMKHNPGN